MSTLSKQQARHILIRKLKALSDHQYNTYSSLSFNNLVTTLRDLQNQRLLRNVLIYIAQKQWREVDVSNLQYIFTETSFDSVSFTPYAMFPNGKYDVVIAPLFGFNSEGYRLGHGGGWYDQLFSDQEGAIKIGVGFECNHIAFDHENHDIPMDLIVTELNCISINR